MTGLSYFLLKIALPPVLVAAMSLSARQWGPTVGGLLMGLPWMTGPVLFFLALDRGDAFAVGACAGIELGVVCISAFLLAYGLASSFAGWPVCLAAAVSAFFATAWVTQGPAAPFLGWAGQFAAPLVVTAAAATLSLLMATLLLPRARSAIATPPLPWWDIPARMLATLALVALIMVSADALGPERSGIVATYPAIFTVIGTFTHAQWGRDALRRTLRGLALSLQTFVLFFLLVGTALPAIGLVPAFLAASLVALAISAFTLLFGRRLRV